MKEGQQTSSQTEERKKDKQTVKFKQRDKERHRKGDILADRHSDRLTEHKGKTSRKLTVQGEDRWIYTQTFEQT